MAKTLKLLTDKIVYIIVWRGRDRNTDAWDDYPLSNRGVFTSKQLAEKERSYLEKLYPPQYDDEADEYEMFFIQEIPVDFLTEGINRYNMQKR